MMGSPSIYAEEVIQSYIIREIKDPVLEAVPVLFDPKASKVAVLRAGMKLYRARQALMKLPRPTIEDTSHPNTHNIIRLGDWLLRCVGYTTENGRYMGLHKYRLTFIDTIFLLASIICEYDGPWRFMMDKIREKAMELQWKPPGYLDDLAIGYAWWHEEDFEDEK